MCAVIRHGLGQFRAALEDYDKILRASPQNPCWYQRCAMTRLNSHKLN